MTRWWLLHSGGPAGPPADPRRPRSREPATLTGDANHFSLSFEPSRDVGLVVEHSKNDMRPGGRVDKPIAPSMNPGMAGLCDLGVCTGCGLALSLSNPAGGLADNFGKVLNGLGSVLASIVAAELGQLVASRPGKPHSDAVRLLVPATRAFASASSLASSASNSRMTSSKSIVRPAATSASPRAMASSQACGARRGVSA